MHYTEKCSCCMLVSLRHVCGCSGNLAVPAGAASDGEEELDADTALDLVNLGIVSPVTRQTAGSLYHRELSRQVRLGCCIFCGVLHFGAAFSCCRCCSQCMLRPAAVHWRSTFALPCFPPGLPTHLPACLPPCCPPCHPPAAGRLPAWPHGACQRHDALARCVLPVQSGPRRGAHLS